MLALAVLRDSRKYLPANHARLQGCARGNVGRAQHQRRRLVMKAPCITTASDEESDSDEPQRSDPPRPCVIISATAHPAACLAHRWSQEKRDSFMLSQSGTFNLADFQLNKRGMSAKSAPTPQPAGSVQTVIDVQRCAATLTPAPTLAPSPAPTPSRIPTEAPHPAPTLRSLEELEMGDDLGSGASGTVRTATRTLPLPLPLPLTPLASTPKSG